MMHFILVLNYKSKLNLFYMFVYINVSFNDIKLNANSFYLQIKYILIMHYI